MTDVRRATRATGLLRQFNEAGVLTAADVHVAARLGALGGEDDERVLLAAALAVRGTRQGSVVLRLADAPDTVLPEEEDAPPVALAWPDPATWLEALAASPLVTGDGGAQPLHLESGGLWLHRYWRQELAVADGLRELAARRPAVDPERLRASLARLWPGEQPDDQRAAAAVCVLSRVAVLGGGPGTGKTTTVSRVLAALLDVADTPPRVALAAPTGKAAARLQEAVRYAALFDRRLTDAHRDLLGPLDAATLHRLLGLRRGSGRPWHGPDNPLPHDVVVVDEASMVSLTLFSRLLAALRPSARLVLVGDPDQLASVEAGAVLADLVDPARDGARTPDLAQALAAAVPHDAAAAPPAPDTSAARVRDGVALLRTVHRHSGAIPELAEAVRAGDPDAVLALLRRGDPAVVFDEVPDDGPLPPPVVQRLRTDALDNARALVAAAADGRAVEALAALERARLLCAHRSGPRGVSSWNALVARWVAEELGVEPRRDGRYAGEPLLVTANDYDSKLYNGDTGVVLARGAELVAVFGRGDAPYEVPLGRLSDVRPVHAMTVHRSQGSQFGAVTVLLPAAASPLGTRGTLYTAVTRAQGRVRVVGSAEAVRAAVTRPVARATGLRERLGRGG